MVLVTPDRGWIGGILAKSDGDEEDADALKNREGTAGPSSENFENTSAPSVHFLTRSQFQKWFPNDFNTNIDDINNFLQIVRELVASDSENCKVSYE